VSYFRQKFSHKHKNYEKCAEILKIMDFLMKKTACGAKLTINTNTMAPFKKNLVS
jgi:hypothetical protein